MKICFVASSFGKGGSDIALLELIDSLQKKLVDCFVILPGDGPLRIALQKRSIDLKIFPYKGWMSQKDSLVPLWKRIGRLFWNLCMAIFLFFEIKKQRPDIVYTNSIGVWVGAFVAKLARKPHIWHIHEFGLEDNNYVFDFGERFSLRFIDKLSTICILVSKALIKKYQQYIPLSKLKVVYQSITISENILNDKTVISNEKDIDIKCVIVGRLVEGKRQDDAIKAISELVHFDINARLWIVGKGSKKYKFYLNQLIKKECLSKYIKFFGFQQNPFKFIKESDILLMCSKSEAFGRITIEAMLMGKPVIGARSGGTMELIKEGVNGFFYTPGDYKELAEKIKFFYEHPFLMHKMGQNGQQWSSKRFTQKRYGEEVLAIFKDILKC